jgi:hypothetical protein
MKSNAAKPRPTPRPGKPPPPTRKALAATLQHAAQTQEAFRVARVCLTRVGMYTGRVESAAMVLEELNELEKHLQANHKETKK